MRNNTKGGFEACPPKPQNALSIIPTNQSGRILPAFLKESTPSYTKKYDRIKDNLVNAKKGLRNITKKHYQDYLKTADGRRFFLYTRVESDEPDVTNYLDILYQTYNNHYNRNNKITSDELANLKYFLNTPGGVQWMLDELASNERPGQYDNLSYTRAYNFYLNEFINLLRCGNYDEPTKNVIKHFISLPQSQFLKAILLEIPEVVLNIIALLKEKGWNEHQISSIFKNIFHSNRFNEMIMNNPEILNNLISLSLRNVNSFLEIITDNNFLPKTGPSLFSQNLCAYLNQFFSRLQFPILEKALQMAGVTNQDLYSQTNIMRQKEFIQQRINYLNGRLNNCISVSIPMSQPGGKKKVRKSKK